MSTWELLIFNLAREFIMDALSVCFYAGFGWFILGVRPHPKRFALACAINIFCHILSRYFAFATFFSYVITAVDLFLISRILWLPRRGVLFWAPFLLCSLLMIFNEITISIIYLLIYPSASVTIEIAGKVHYAFLPYTYPVLIALTLVNFSAIIFLAYWAHRLILLLKQRGLSILRMLRLGVTIILLFVVLAMFGFDFDILLSDHADAALQTQAIKEKLFSYGLYFIFSILLFLYVWQDLRQIILYQTNKFLSVKNDAYQQVIDSTREYRHNMANLLYGLEGVILTGDVAEIGAYYQDMAHRCARINNENVIALNRLKDPALSALILRKLNDAEERNIPIYLSVNASFSFNGLPPSVLCESLGNLIDNALTAAEHSSTPRVDMTMSSTPEYNEILIANTFADDADLHFLSETPRSSKPNHQATGLISVRKNLNKYSDICFNQFLHGRYAESSLCEYKF